MNRGCAVGSFVDGVTRALQRFSHHGAQFGFIFNERRGSISLVSITIPGMFREQRRPRVRRREAPRLQVALGSSPTNDSLEPAGIECAVFTSERDKSLAVLGMQSGSVKLTTYNLRLKTIFTAPTPGRRPLFSSPLPCHPIAAGVALIPFFWHQSWRSCH